MKIHLTLLLLALSTLVSNAQIINTVAGSGSSGYAGDGGIAIAADLNEAVATVTDTFGNLFISDSQNHVVRKVDTNGVISTVIGNGTQGYSGDGGPALSAQLSFPSGIAIDDSGSIFIADRGNSVVRKINSSGIISTIAGNGTPGYSGDSTSATSAQLFCPAGITVDRHGSLYITDMCGCNCLRKVDRYGIISTIISPQLMAFPTGVVIDSKYNLFVCNTAGQEIWKSDTLGNYTVYAGTGAAGYGGDGGPASAAKFNFPNYMAYGPVLSLGIDKSDNIYIPDCGNQRVRKIDSSGIIKTIVGSGFIGFSGDGGLATIAKITNPSGVNIDRHGNIYVADWGNARIREVTYTNGLNDIVTEHQIKIFPVPSRDLLKIELKGQQGILIVSDLTGKTMWTGAFSQKLDLDIAGFPKGTYILKLQNLDGILTSKFIIE